MAVFVDGDFWHGRDWERRRKKLAGGKIAAYWTKKIEYNRARSASVNRTLRDLGWTVLRLWESDIKRDPTATARTVERLVREGSTETVRR